MLPGIRFILGKMKWCVHVMLLIVILNTWTQHVEGLYGGGGNSDRHWHPHVDCSYIHAYEELTSLLSNDRCWSVNDMFRRLHDIKSTSEHCMETAIRYLSDHFSDMPRQCACSGNDEYKLYYDPNDGVTDNFRSCLYNPDYSRVFNEFFYHFHQDAAPKCRTHHTLWDELSHLTHGDDICIIDLIDHLEFQFRNGDPCRCTYVPEVTTTPIPTPTTTSTPSVVCTNIDSYNTLMLLEKSDTCLSANSVWHYLDSVENIDVHCRKHLVNHLANTYSNRNSECDCQPTGTLIDERVPHLDGGSFADCNAASGSTYHDIDDLLFSHTKENGCKDHSLLWPKLADVKDVHHGYVDCTKDLISRTALKYPNLTADPCVCSKKTTTISTTTVTTNTTITTPAPTTTTPVPTTTTTTTQAPTTTTAPITTTQTVTTTTPIVVTTSQSGFKCGHSQTIKDIATAVHVHSPLAQPCALTGNDEALVISECNMPASSAWKRGENILADCQLGSATIPMYVPIATFTSDTYVSTGGHSAIFLGCSATGFLAVVQYCGNSPMVIDMSSEPNANAYYTVM